MILISSNPIHFSGFIYIIYIFSIHSLINRGDKFFLNIFFYKLKLNIDYIKQVDYYEFIIEITGLTIQNMDSWLRTNFHNEDFLELYALCD